MENAAGAGVSADRPRILVVEDEMIVALYMEDVLADLGYDVAGVVSHVDAALARASAADFDMAILDVHLNGKEVFPLADLLAERKIPFAFATGYGERGIPESHRGRPVLQKPFRPEDLEKALKSLS